MFELYPAVASSVCEVSFILSVRLASSSKQVRVEMSLGEEKRTLTLRNQRYHAFRQRAGKKLEDDGGRSLRMLCTRCDVAYLFLSLVKAIWYDARKRCYIL